MLKDFFLKNWNNIEIKEISATGKCVINGKKSTKKEILSNKKKNSLKKFKNSIKNDDIYFF